MPTPTVNAKVRDAAERDIPAITAIYAHHVRFGSATFEELSPDSVEMLARWKSLREKQLPYLVVEVDDVVRGYSYAALYHPRSAYRFTVEDSIYVDPEWQGRGLGVLLLQTLLSSCERRGYHQIVSLIGGSDNAGSVALHSKLGFEHVGVLKNVGWKFERWHDVVLMQKAIKGHPRPLDQ